MSEGVTLRMVERRRRMASAYGGSGDSTAPTLTSPFALPFGDTSGHIGVVTDEGNGTLYYVLTTSSSTPSAAQVKAGQDHTGAAAAASGSQSVSATGTQTATPTGLSSNTLYYPYWVHRDAAGNDSAVKGLTSFTTLTTGTSDTSFDNLIAAASVAPTDFRKGLIARFIGALYAAGVWSKMDVMWVLAAHDEQFGRLNWITPGSFTLSAVNSPTFTTDRGFAGNGTTSYLDTGWDAGTNGVNFTQNNALAFLYARQGVGGTGGFGTRTAFTTTLTLTDGRLNGGTAVSMGGSPSYPQSGFIRRNTSTDNMVGRDGVQTATAARTSGSPGTVDWTFGAVANSFTSGQMAGGLAGAYLDDTENAALYAAWNAYLVALGADT